MMSARSCPRGRGDEDTGGDPYSNIPWIRNYYHTTTSVSQEDIRRQGQYSLQLAYYLLWYNVSNSPPETRLAEDIITLIKVWGLSRARQLHRQIFSTWENISFLKYIF